MCSYCDHDDGHTRDECPKRLEEKFADSREYNPDGTRKVQLREGETRDDSAHSSTVNETLANADAADLEKAGIDPDDVADEDEKEVRTDGTTDEPEWQATTGLSFDEPEPTHESIARDLAEYLRENPGVCAEGNVHGWRWVRYADGEWHATDYGGKHRRKSYVRGTTFEPEATEQWLAAKPVTLIPATEAYLWGPSEKTVWQDADQQDVFTDADRCFYCGDSERTTDLERYETTEQGECLFCADCHESWDRADEIVGRAVRADGGTDRWDAPIIERTDLYDRARAQWSDDAQLAKLSEEAAELSAVASRALNGQADPDAFLKELIDARLMIEQFAYCYSPDRIEPVVGDTIDDLEHRLDRFGDEREVATDGGEDESGTEQLIETCQGCGEDYAPLFGGYFVDTDDIGKGATGGTAEVFRQDAEKFGEWNGFEEEDIGPWCEDCSWKIQRKRTRTTRSVEPDTDGSEATQ